MRSFALALLALLAFAPAAAKDTGLIFVSNEKTNNVVVIDPKTYKVVRDIKVARAVRAICISMPRTTSSMWPAATTT